MREKIIESENAPCHAEKRGTLALSLHCAKNKSITIKFLKIKNSH